jgi:hypothetical protein
METITANDSAVQNVQPETISELARRHMQDENHTTSDEEMRNAKVEFSENVAVDDRLEQLVAADNETVLPALPGEEATSSDADDNSKQTPPNPYTVLGS